MAEMAQEDLRAWRTAEATIGLVRRTPVAVLAAVLLAAVAAAPADASKVLVLGKDGHVRARQERAAVARSAKAGPPARRVRRAARARAAARRGPTVPKALQQLVDEGALDAATAAGYRDTWNAARRTVRKLRGYRKGQLQAVIANVDALAAGRRLSVSRLPSQFLTLERNRAWWAAAAIPRSGQRVAFADSQLVWQHYPGQGLQIQWLGTFGKANALYKDRENAALRSLLDEAIGLATQRAGGIAFEYLFRFGGGSPPWVSGLAQGTGLTALSRAATRFKYQPYWDAASAALGIFRRTPPTGVRVATGVGAHYLQYSYARSLRIANGFVQALNGLHDYATLSGDPEGRALFTAGEAELRATLPSFDTGAWSLYARPGGESDLGYHTLLRDFLVGLCDRLQSEIETAQRTGAAVTTPDPALYCETADRFSADLLTPPVLEFVPTTLRAKRNGWIKLKVDKVSTVSVTVLRDGKVVLARTLRLGRGRHAIPIRPRKAAPLEIRLRAVDLAGNAATADGQLDVRRR
jgi:D-glucuronyl C5-epimerase C-terminus